MTGEAKLALAGWEEEFVFLALGVLIDLDLVGIVTESQRPKRGPGGSLAPMSWVKVDMRYTGWIEKGIGKGF